MEPIMELLFYLSLFSSGIVIVTCFFPSFRQVRHIFCGVKVDNRAILQVEQVKVAIRVVPLFFTYLRKKIPTVESLGEEVSFFLCFC